MERAEPKGGTMKAEWITGKYNFHRLKLGMFEACVSWANGGGYEVNFESARLASNFESLSQAKHYAEKLARKKLNEALEALSEANYETN